MGISVPQEESFMRSLKVAAGMTAGLLVLSGCSSAVFSTDGGCGVITPTVANPEIYVANSQDTSMDVPRVLTDLEWQISDVPADVTSVYSGAVTTFPISEIATAEFSNLGAFAPASVDQSEYHVVSNHVDEIAEPIKVGPNYQLDGHEIQNLDLIFDFLNLDEVGGGPEEELIFSLATHFPVTIISSCDTDFRDELEQVMKDVLIAQPNDDELFDFMAGLEKASSHTVYPGFKADLINLDISPDGLGVAVSSSEEGWIPLNFAVSVWSDDFYGPEADPDGLELTKMSEDWASILLLLDFEILSRGLGTEEDAQPVFWNSQGGLMGGAPTADLLPDGTMLIGLNQKLNFDLFAEAINTDPENFGPSDETPFFYPDHFLLYGLFVKYSGEDEPVQLAYSFERVTANQSGELTAISSSGPFQVSQIGEEDPHDQILLALFEDTLDNRSLVSAPKLNGLTFNQYADLEDSERILHENFGTFSSGSSLVGLDSGLVIVPGYNPESMLRRAQAQDSTEFTMDGSYYTGAGETLSETEVDFPNSVVGALAAAVSDALPDFEAGFQFSSAEFQTMNDSPPDLSIVDATSLSFVLDPTADFFKMDFVLGMTEYGEWNPDTGKWEEDVSAYPDGLGIFVKSESESWLDAVNCAAIPTTNTYLSMIAAGILPPGDPVANAVTARQNYLALVSETAKEGYVLSPESRVGFDLLEPAGDLIPPPMIALATEQNSAVRFVTTVMTCVVDISDIRFDEERVEVGIAVSNLFDAIFPPAMFVSNGSIRFAENAVATQQVEERIVIEQVAQQQQQEQAQAVAAPYSGPVITSGPVTAAPGGQALLTGSGLESVTTVEVNGRAIAMDSASGQQLRFTLPLDITVGTKDLVLVSSFGRLSLPGMLRVVATVPGSTGAEPTASIKRIGDTVRLFATEVIGAGKVQLMLNGKEIAWVRAVDNADPKLRFANGAYYLVRTVVLAEGKNVFEVFVDGERVRRVAYTK